MILHDGKFRLGPQAGKLLLKTSRTGLGRKAGHDLTIEVTRWTADVEVNAADPGGSSVTAEIGVGSLEIREGAGGLKPLTDADRADIKATIAGKILRTADHPVIVFRSSQVTGTLESFTVTGTLEIMGNAQPAELTGGITGGRLRGHAIITQSRWGIKPYSAFAGALRLADGVRVEFDLEVS
jgi:polyisoprenoid-binding protein YceI